MSRIVIDPPSKNAFLPDGARVGGWWRETEPDGRILCELCPRACHLKPGDRGFCFVRENRDGQLALTTYGRSTGFCIDPIEKKPLNHFYPGTSILSFGTAGCNLGCKFCQNWDISKSREVERLSEQATPEMIAEAARSLGCHSVAYTYNDPIIWAEYAIDVAKACREVGVKSVAVTAGYIMPEVREPFFRYIDAANVDLKAFTEDFYHKITYSHLQPVLDTLHWLKHESDVWFEITNLIIPDANDSPDELRQMCDWVLEHVGDEVPMHFTAFHPDFRMTDRPRTPHETLLQARELALQQGVKYAYVGNVNDAANQSTYCPHCGGTLIERNWYELGQYHLRSDACGHCGGKVAGRFADRPGTWGRKRQPVRISQYARPSTTSAASPAVTPITLPASSLLTSSTPSKSTQGKPMTTENTTNVPNSPELTDDQQAAIHLAACEVVAAGVSGRQVKLSDATMASAATDTVMGSFVTLKRQGRLRACCGMLGHPVPLAQAVQHAAMRTATEDSRFPTISQTELEHLSVDVTLLYGFQPMTARGEDRVGEVEIGRHGLQIQRGQNSGLLLPVVATENNWDARQFLDAVCRKAGLPTTAWQDDATRLLKFEGFSIPGQFDQRPLGAASQDKPPRFPTEQMKQLADACRMNVIALARGAVPNYYLSGLPDGTVEGVAVSVAATGLAEPIRLLQLSLRPGVPLQATLFKLVESAAQTLQRARVSDLGSVKLDVTVLYDPAMQGTVAEPSLNGVDPAKRAVLVMESGKSAWRFDPSCSAEELLKAAAEDARVGSPAMASVFSLAAQSTEESISISSVPRPQAGASVRPAAMAGKFYPADAAELNRMLDDMLPKDAKPADWPAVMVPHAGLIYSGRLAAETLARVNIPDTVIVIGPKHTRFGVEWSVAPHQTWAIPGGQVQSDPELARKLADAIPGLELDAAAHQQEHGIEVELPLIHRLAPNAKVVGIAMGAGDLERCRQFAKGLAEVVRGMEKPPLLVISSDMNHFATDDENRRLDEIALQSLETLDPANVFDTVVSRHNISMCGVRPAVAVMEALREMNLLKKCERVGYSTSADVTGDKSRVVGYAGMLFA